MRILFFGSIFLFFFALGQDLPSLPDQFETIVELTFEDQNTTAYLFEYYDYPNDRAKFEFHWNGDSFVEILDYKKGVRTEILDHWNCTINAINATDDDENGISDHGHLRNISSLFEFGVEYNEVYTGVNTVRGIPCDTWVANMTHTWSNGANATYTSEFYFSVPYWNMREDDYNEHRVPVAVIRRGIYVFNNTINNFHFHYHFVHFVAGPVADEHFLPPQDTYCRSELAIELPELPTDFSTGVELTIVEKNYTAISREFYDYTHNRFRIDFFSHRGWNRFYYFEDTRTSYEITNGTGCTSRKYNDSQDPFEENGHLRSSADFLRFGAQFDEQYQGERVIRGIPCDFWVSNVTQNHTRNGTTFWTNYTLSYYFSVQNWKMASHRILEEHRVPVRAEIKGKDNRNGVINNFHHVYDFVDFQFGTPETWNFRIDPEHGCEGRTTSAPTTATSSTSEEQDDDDDDSGGGVSSGGAFGLFVFGAVVGVAIGATVAFVILKRKLKNYAGGGSFPRDGSGRVELDS